MKKALLLLLYLTGILLAGYAGYRGYKVWKQDRMMNLARGFMAKGDSRNAFLSVQQVLQNSPANVEATRFMADLMLMANSPNAILWRSRVVDLAPGSVDDRLALARLAIANHDLTAASNAIVGLNETAKQTPAYHATLGSMAAAVGNFAEAETHFVAASRLETNNAATQFNLALARLAQTNLQTKAEGRASLASLGNHPILGCRALRELVSDALRNSQKVDALIYSKQLMEQTNSGFGDRLLRLDALRGAGDPEFQPTLLVLEREANNDPVKAVSLLTWKLTKIGAADALASLKNLPQSIQTNTIVALVSAECYVRLKDWRALQTSIARQNWQEMEFVRHAFLARAYRAQELNDSAKTEWDQAVKSALTQKQSLAMLLGLTSQWHWDRESRDLLWTMVNQFPGDRGAVTALTQNLFSSGLTQELLNLLSQEIKRVPDDAAIKNNLAMTALLLNARQFKPHDLAREAYEKVPTNFIYASTYAFSLYLQSKPTAALQVMEKLPPQALQQPGIAGYYGLALAATGNKTKAKYYLGIARNAPSLPEEKKLFETARASL